MYIRFSTGLQPIIDPDINGYIMPAVSWIKTHEFIHFCRSFPYPLFCTLVVSVSKSFAAIVATQHVLALFSLPLLAKTFRKWIVYYHANEVSSHVLALVILLYIGMLPHQTIIEKSIRPESVMLFLFSVFFYVLSVFIIEKNNRHFWIGPLVFLNSFLYLFFPRWGFCLPVVLVVTAWYCVNDVQPKQMFKHYFAALMFAYLFLYLPEEKLIDKYDAGNRSFLAEQYFYVHADMVQQTLSLPGITLCSNADRMAYKYLRDSLGREIVENKNISSIGFDPDGLMYGKANKDLDSVFLYNTDSNLVKAYWGFNLREFRDRKPGDRTDSLLRIDLANHMESKFNGVKSAWKKAFLYKLIAKSICHSYIRYCSKIAKQTVFYYNPFLPKKRMLPWSEPVNEVKHIDNFAKLTAGFTMADRPVEEYGAIIAFPLFQTEICNLIYYIISYSYLLLLLFSFIKALKTQDKKIFLFLLLHFSLVMTVAVIHTFDNDRYGWSIFVPAVFCYFLMAVYCLAPTQRWLVTQ